MELSLAHEASQRTLKQRNLLAIIGCGLAGYRRDQIEPMFAGAPDNVLWPPEWS